MNQICSLGHCECDVHTVHKLSQWRLTADWLAPRESDCSQMHSKVSTYWLSSYIKATQPVLEILKMAGYFPDSPRILGLLLLYFVPNCVFGIQEEQKKKEIYIVHQILLKEINIFGLQKLFENIYWKFLISNFRRVLNVTQKKAYNMCRKVLRATKNGLPWK